MSDNLEILYFHGGIIVNTNNSITYNWESHEFLTATSNMFLNELSRMLCDRHSWNMFEIDVKLLGGCCKPGLVKLVMSVYQCLGMRGSIRLICWSSTWIVNLDEETLLIWSWLGFQVALRKPHQHHKQLVHLG